METSQEWQWSAKSRRELYGPIEWAICGLHPYKELEILAVVIVAGSQGNLHWIDAEVSIPQ